MKRALIFLVAAAISAATCQAQEVTTSESWSGKIALGAQNLNIGFVIKHLSDGKQICTMDVPEQGARDIPVELKKNDADSLLIAIPALRASYKGRRLAADSIEGIFTQNGMSFSLDLKAEGIRLRRPQMPMPPFAYTTEEVVFRNEAEGATLSGTLTYPVDFERYGKREVPVVLLITGSGGQNRDEEIFDHKPFLIIADFLAKNGIASLRYDDRGVGKSTGPTAATTTENNLADAEAGISFLRSLKTFGKIGVIGHSEGGTIAFMMGAKGSVDFLISLAGSAANGIDVIVGQNEAAMQLQGLPQGLISDYAAALRLIYKDRASDVSIDDHSLYIEELCKSNNLTLPPGLIANLEKCITYGGEWFTWFLKYNPADAIRQITCPVMALNGDLDFQVLSKDNLPIIKENLPDNDMSLIKEYHDLNHLFQHCTPSTALSYGAIEQTISEEVLSDMVNWIKATLQRL